MPHPSFPIASWFAVHCLNLLERAKRADEDGREEDVAEYLGWVKSYGEKDMLSDAIHDSEPELIAVAAGTTIRITMEEGGHIDFLSFHHVVSSLWQAVALLEDDSAILRMLKDRDINRHTLYVGIMRERVKILGVEGAARFEAQIREWEQRRPMKRLEWEERPAQQLTANVATGNESPPAAGRQAEYDEVVHYAHQLQQQEPYRRWREIHQECLARFGIKAMPCAGGLEGFAAHVGRRRKKLGLPNPRRDDGAE